MENRIYNYAMNDAEVLALVDGTLPVIWGDFTAEKKEQTSLLNWTTLQERNVSKFIVERSLNGAAFETIGEMKAVGSSSQRNKYDFIDNSPLDGANYYRIRQLDHDGKMNFSVIRSLSFDRHPTIITITPNPARDVIKIGIPGNQKTLQVTIYSSAGQKLNSFMINGQNGSYNVSQHPAGLYNIQIVGEGVRYSGKVLIRK